MSGTIGLITPNITLTIRNDVLHSSIRDPAERLGVILSGSGSDGAKDIQTIKEAGGVTFAEKRILPAFLECRAAPSKMDAWILF